MATTTLELKQISKVVYTAAPVQSNATGNEDGPQVILIFGWMDAQFPHLKKYVDSYAKLYPHASQILVRSGRDFAWSGRKTIEAALSPVVDSLKKEGLFQAPAPSILVHVFSNGGAFQLAELSRILQSSGQTSGAPSAIAIVYDSSPGKLDLSSVIAAFLVPVRSVLLRMFLSIPLTVLYCMTNIISFIKRQPRIDIQMRAALNQAQVLPWTNVKTPRLYIYSDNDQLVAQKDVAEHIAEAKELGFNVRAEYFKGSSHVSHARLDPDRYWDAVRNVWADATVC